MNFNDFNNILNENADRQFSSFSQMKKGDYIHVVGEMFDLYGQVTHTVNGGMKLKVTRILEIPSDSMPPEDEYGKPIKSEFDSDIHIKIGTTLKFGTPYGYEDEETEFEYRDFTRVDAKEAKAKIKNDGVHPAQIAHEKSWGWIFKEFKKYVLSSEKRKAEFEAEREHSYNPLIYQPNMAKKWLKDNYSRIIQKFPDMEYDELNLKDKWGDERLHSYALSISHHAQILDGRSFDY